MIEITLFEAALSLAGGLFLLGWSAGRFVDESVGLARRLGLSPFAIGMILVGFGTSLPELMVSVMAAFDRHADLALGNAYGSCSYNIAVILGVLALIHPLRIKPRFRRTILPILQLAVLVSAVLLTSGRSVSRADGFVLLMLFLAAVVFSCRRDFSTLLPAASPVGEFEGRPLPLAISLFVLLASSALVVWSAESVARQLGVSELTIGLTVVAAGTSLPELATSIAALRRRQTELILGNILGSNLFNILVVVGTSALIRPIQDVATALLWRDLPFLFLTTSLLFTRRLTKPRALLLVAAFILYTLLTCLRP